MSGATSAKLLPRLSSDVLFTRVGDRFVVYDCRAEAAHVLNEWAGELLDLCDGRTQIADLVAQLSTATGAPLEQVAGDVDGFLVQLREANLFDQSEPIGRVTEASRVPFVGAHRSRPLAVLDERVVVWSDQPWVISAIEHEFAPLVHEGAATKDYLVAEDGAGQWRIDGRRPELHCLSFDHLMGALQSELNGIAAHQSSMITLHSAGVTDQGRAILLPGESGAGKSTITAALVQAGWGYLTDEAIGLRNGLAAVAFPKPLTLDRTSREMLGLDSERDSVAVSSFRAGARGAESETPLARVVVLDRAGDAPPLLSDELAPLDAFTCVLAHVTNLGLVGQAGLDALAELAERVPVCTLTYAALDDALAVLADLR